MSMTIERAITQAKKDRTVKDRHVIVYYNMRNGGLFFMTYSDDPVHGGGWVYAFDKDGNYKGRANSLKDTSKLTDVTEKYLGEEEKMCPDCYGFGGDETGTCEECEGFGNVPV